MNPTPDRRLPLARSIAGAVLLGLLLIGCAPERQAGTAASDFERVAGEALQAMQQKAAGMSATGAALVAWIPGQATTAWSSRMLVVGTFIKGDGNVLAMAYTKAAEMADTLTDSGSGVRPVKKGENGWKGGVIRPVPGGYVLATFSGAKSEDDVAISQAGVEVLRHSFDAPAAGR